MKQTSLLGDHFRSSWLNLIDAYVGSELGPEQWERESQGTASVTIFSLSLSQKIHSSEQIQQSHSGNSHLWSMTRFMGHNQEEGRGKTHSLQTELRQIDVRFGFLHDGLTNSCLTKGTFLSSLWTSPIFQGILICESRRALVSRPREVCFFLSFFFLRCSEAVISSD